MIAEAGLTLWRISNHGDLDGLGGERASGRWHTAARGKRIVYLSGNAATALLEVLANLKGDPRLFPSTYQLVKVGVSGSVSVTAANLPASEAMEDTQAFGDAWLAGMESALLVVPSVPAPESVNYLLNPRHADACRVRVESVRKIAFDKRLFRVGDSASPTDN